MKANKLTRKKSGNPQFRPIFTASLIWTGVNVSKQRNPACIKWNTSLSARWEALKVICCTAAQFIHLPRCVEGSTMLRYHTVSAFELEFVHCHTRWRAEEALAFEKAIFEGLLCECLPSRTNEAIEPPRDVNELLLHTRPF